MTPRIDNEARIDVLAVLDSLIDRLSRRKDAYSAYRLAGLRETRAAFAELLGATRALMHYAPGGHNCVEFHHAKADAHFAGEVCKPMERWRDAWEHARAALARCGGAS